MGSYDWHSILENKYLVKEYEQFANMHGIDANRIPDKATGREIKKFMLSIKERIETGSLIPINIPDTSIFKDDEEYEFWADIPEEEQFDNWSHTTESYFRATKEAWYFEGYCWAEQFSLLFARFKQIEECINEQLR